MQWKVDIHQINVNTGDSALIIVSQGTTIQRAILIDGGKTDAAKSVVKPLLHAKLGMRALDAIVVTHYDTDHAGGIKSLLNDQDFITTFIKKSKNPKDSSDLGTILYDLGDAIGQEKGCPYQSRADNFNTDHPGSNLTRIASEGTAINRLLGRDFMWLNAIPTDGARTTESLNSLRIKDAAINAGRPALYCIAINKKVLQHPGPGLDIVPGAADDANDRSIALVLVDGANKIRYYTAGDSNEAYESDGPTLGNAHGISAWLAREINGYRVDGMKISHHGSQNSTPSILLRTLNPKEVIISAGKNVTYKHPSPSIVVYLSLYSRYQSPLVVMGTNCPYYLNLTDSKRTSITAGADGNAIPNLMLNLFDSNSKIQAIRTEMEALRSAFANKDPLLYFNQLIELWDEIGMPEVAPNNFPKRLMASNVDILPTMSIPMISTSPVNNTNSAKSAYGPIKSTYRDRKAKKKLLSSLSATTPVVQTTWVITSSKAANGDIPLLKDSDFDQFVSQLPTGTMTLSTFTSNPTATGLVISGTISNVFDDIFYYAGVDSVTVSLQGTKTGDFYDFKRQDILFSSQFDATQVNATQPLIFSGTIQADSTLNLTIPASSTTSADLISNGQLCGFLEDATDDAIASALKLLFAAISPNHDAILFPVNPAQSSLIFYPANNNVTQLKLVSQLTSQSSSFTLFDKLHLSQLNVAFSTSLHTLSDTTVSQNSECEFDANLSLDLSDGSNFSTAIAITIFPTGIGSFSISPTAGSSEQLIDNFSKTLLDFDVSSMFNQLSALGVVLNLVTAMTIRFDLVQKTLLTLTISSEIVVFGYLFDITLNLPNGYLCGQLSSKMSDATLSKLLNNHNVLIPSQDLDGFPLTEVSFAVSPESGYYSFDATIGSQDASIWAFNSQMNLEELAISLTKDSSSIQASITAFIAIGTRLVSVEGLYQENDWSFNANISDINLSDLFAYIGIDSSDMPVKDLNITDITIKLDVTAKTFGLSADTAIGKVVFVIGQQATLLSLSPPSIDSISLPVVGTIPKLIDSLQLLYVSQDIKSDTDPMIKLYENISGTSLQMSSVGLLSGLQLCIYFDSILSQGQDPFCLNLMSANKAQPSSSSALVAMSQLTETPTTAPPTIWLSIKRALGPILLERLGFSFHDSKLWVLFDADLIMGELILDLQGLGFGFTLDAVNVPEITISGLGLAYQSGTCSISGDFLHDPTNSNRYQGIATISSETFMAAALGSYDKTDNGNPSIFVFARVNKPVGGPPFFYVLGFSGGFGYNQSLRIPTQDQVVNFPMVQGSINPLPINLLADMQQLMTDLTPQQDPWVRSQDGEQWLAFGIDFTTFELINSRALMVAEFGKDLQFALLGRSMMQLPMGSGKPVTPDNPSPPSAIAYAEMGVEATYNPEKGLLAMTAVLSPNSYVITPDCHLTGGFAFYNWTKDQKDCVDQDGNYPLAGDFVLTLGGYHPAFTPKSWYPQVPRLGFNWQIDDNLMINGDAYFAITPSAAMMGGGLQVTFSAGDLHAWLNTNADFLIEWHPFEYMAKIGVSVGASYRVNLLFTSVTLSVEIGADLTIQGPPTSGNVDIDWYIISFSIPFGPSSRDISPTLHWLAFRQFLPARDVATPNQDVHALSSTDDDAIPPKSINKIIVSRGLNRQIVPPASTAPIDPTKLVNDKPVWVVRADEFIFYTTSAIPATSTSISGSASLSTPALIGGTQTPTSLNIKPMRLTQITHAHNVVIEMASIDLNGVITATPYPDIADWICNITQGNVPDALWGTYSQDTSTNLDTVLLPNYITGLSVQAPKARQGASPGPIVMEVLGNVPVNDASLPLTIDATPITVPQQDVGGSYNNIATSIATSAVATRGQVVNSLSALGLFKSTPPLVLDTMALLAKNTASGKAFLEPPLRLGAPS